MNQEEKGPLLLLYERLYVVVVVTGAALVGSWFISKGLTPVYKSHARAFLPAAQDRFSLTEEQSNAPIGPKLPVSNAEQQASVIGLLRSLELRRQVATQLPQVADTQSGDRIDSTFLEKNVDFTIDKYNLFVITAWHTQPSTASLIANTYLEQFEQQLKQQVRARSSANREVLEQTITAEVEALGTAEQARLDFMQARSTVDFGVAFNTLTNRINTLRSAILDRQFELETLDEKVDFTEAELTRLREEAEFVQGSRSEIRNPRITELTERIARIRQEIEVLKLSVQPDYPNYKAKVTELQSTMAELAGIEDEERIEGSRSYQVNPHITTLERDLIGYQKQQALLGGEIAVRQAELDELLVEWRQMPTIKVQLDQLEEEIRKRRETLNNLRSRRAEYSLLEARQPSFLQIVEVAQDAIKPAYPNITLNLIAAAMLGLVISIVIVVLMGRVRHYREQAPW